MRAWPIFWYIYIYIYIHTHILVIMRNDDYLELNWEILIAH